MAPEPLGGRRPGDRNLGQRRAALIFDCDGTLVDSEGHYALVDSQVFARYGVAMSAAEIRSRYMGVGLSTMLADIAERHAMRFPDDIVAQLDLAVEAQLTAHLQPVRRVQPALAELSEAGWAMAVATNSRLARTTRNLAITGLDGYFDGRIAAVDMVASPKPAPDVYFRAAAMLGADPHSCIAVEDSSVGAAAAVAAGMLVIGYAPPDHGAQVAAGLTAAGVHLLIDDMAGLVGAIETALELRELI